jgi:CRISPR-associated endonuclease Csn1
MANYVLGLDLGANSVGWAIIAQDGGQTTDGKRVLTGVRVFPEGVDKLNTKKEKPRGQDRRLARGQRRMHQRRRHRRQKLLAVLRSAGLLPQDSGDLLNLLASDPYPLRAKGLDQRLGLHELGRALFHLSRRRGFKSNRKQEKSKEEGDVAKETAELRRKIDESGGRTLGEYLARLGEHFRHDSLESERIRNRYTLRSMYEVEFEKLWPAQVPHYPDVLTNELKEKVKDAIFFQRPLRFDPDVIGQCELEPGEKRCPRAHWVAQKFRMLQDINLLKVIDPTGEERPLNARERATLAEALAPKKEMTFDEIRRLLGFLESQTFNLEELSKRKSLKGNPVEAALSKKPLDKWYQDLPQGTREKVYDSLAEEQDEQKLRALAMTEWALNDAQADKLLKITLPTGHFKVSLKAIRKMMPHLQSGHIYSEAKELAGYGFVPQGEVRECLPPVEEAVKHLTNPLVRRALTEARKVVNAIVRDFGKPGEIVVELARDMKNTAEKRRELFWENVERREQNDEIRKRLVSEFNLASPSRDDVIKFRLWEECARTCPYTGRSIPANKLFTPEIQIEHIFPYSRTLDDSFMNKSLCYEDENRRKHNRTPYEAYSQDQPKYDGILQRTAKFPYTKRRKFSQKEVELDECVRRQLNDTRYVSRAAVGYLRVLYDDPQKVRCVKGGTTAELRHQWGLDEVLGLKGEKNRDDHRHHAVDAVVIALTTRSALQRLSSVKYNPQRPRFDPPWEGFREEVAASVTVINVSHRPTRRLAGALHEETAYGPGKEPNTFVHRVPVENLTGNQVSQIRDPVIRKIVQEAAKERGLGKALVNPPLRMPSGVPIRKVRIETVEKTAFHIRTDDQGRPIKCLLPGGNHHVEIFELPDGSWTGRAVSRFDANQRLLQGKPVVNRNPSDGARFVMWLCNNDMLLIDKNSQPLLYRVQNISVSSPLLVLRLHTAARTDDKEKTIKATRHLVATWDSFRKLAPKKVTVGFLGRVHPCND